MPKGHPRHDPADSHSGPAAGDPIPSRYGIVTRSRPAPERVGPRAEFVCWHHIPARPGAGCTAGEGGLRTAPRAYVDQCRWSRKSQSVPTHGTRKSTTFTGRAAPRIAGPAASPPSTDPAVERDERIEIVLPDGTAVRVSETVGTTALRRVLSALRG